MQFIGSRSFFIYTKYKATIMPNFKFNFLINYNKNWYYLIKTTIKIQIYLIYNQSDQKRAYKNYFHFLVS